MQQPPLTRRQIQILDFYRAYTRERGLSPTLEEVAQHFGVNKVTIFGHVAELERKGVLARAAKGISRGRQLVHASKPGPRHADDQEGEDAQAQSVTSVTILGRIAAGAPIEAMENPEALELADLLPRDRDVYALRVRGDSMIDDGVHDGDIVLVERRSVARDGEMVVAVLPDEHATLKRLYREPKGWRLQPSHPTLEPLHVPEVEVRGVVIGVVRRF
jgi:repressor LexA